MARRRTKGTEAGTDTTSKPDAHRDAFDALGPRPTTPDELHAWLITHTGLRIARTSLIDGHQAPFDYLVHTFLGDLVPKAEQTTRDCVVWANRGGGKTLLGAVATLLDLIYKPGIEIRILAGSMVQSQRMYAHLRRLFEREAFAPLVRGKITAGRLALHNRSGVELLAQSQTSVRGTRVQKLRCDEVDLFHPDVWEAAQLTTRSSDCGGVWVRGCVECLSTMHNPHGVMQGIVAEANEGKRRLLRWGVVDALEHCPPERHCRVEEKDCPLLPECVGRAKDRLPERAGHITIDDAITQKSRVSLTAWQSEMLCMKPRRRETVVPEFDSFDHVFRDDTALRTGDGLWIAGMDFGIRGTAILWARVDASGVVRVVDERCMADVLLSEHVEAMLRGLEREGVAKWPHPAWVGVDPAGMARSAMSIDGPVDVVRKAGFKVRGPRRRTSVGLELLRARLRPAAGTPRLFVHERCDVLIRSLVRYRYKPGSDQPNRSEGHDHAVDALRYMIQNLDMPLRTVTTNYMFKQGVLVEGEA